MSLDWSAWPRPDDRNFHASPLGGRVAAALLVALVVIAVVRSGMTEFGSLVFRVAVIAIAVVSAGPTSSLRVSATGADDRPALDQRCRDLVGRAIALGPPSPARATNTETVEGAC